MICETCGQNVQESVFEDFGESIYPVHGPRVVFRLGHGDSDVEFHWKSVAVTTGSVHWKLVDMGEVLGDCVSQCRALSATTVMMKISGACGQTVTLFRDGRSHCDTMPGDAVVMAENRRVIGVKS